MSQCTLAQQNSIIDLIRESFEIYGSVDLNDLELEISQVLLEGFTFKEFSDNTDIINTLKEYGVNIEELIGDVSSSPLKSNIVKNISTYQVEDLFKGLPTARQYFEGYVNNLMVKNTIIGSSDSDTYVSTDLELTNNLHNLKNDLFIEIQDFLKSKGLLTTDASNLFEKGRVKDFSHYSNIMNLISEYFFSGNDIGLFTFSGKLIPNLNISLEDNESIFRAYNNMILLSNFDSVLNTMFKGMIEVNYNYFNHLDSIIDNNPKYKLKVAANSLLYWNNDTHDSKSSENKEDKITNMIVGSIPMYNRNNVKTSEFMEMKDLYLFASMIHNFELKFGNKFKNNDNYNFEYFNVNSNDSLRWYIDQIKKSINKEEGFISELNESLKNDPNNKHGYTFKSISNIIYSLDNFFNDPELNIEAKEKTSSTSLVSAITQVLNNNYGSTYSVFDTKEGLKVQNMYQQDFNNTYINDSVLNYMKSTDVDKNMYNLKNAEELKRFNELFDPENTKVLADDIEIYVQENPKFTENFSKYITEKTGIPFSRASFQTLINEMKDFHNLKTISGDYLKNRLGDLIRNMQTVKISNAFRNFTGNTSIETSGKILSPVVNSSFYIALSNVYLADFVTKPVMNIETAIGNKVPSFRSTVLTFKDTELFDLQREFQKNGTYNSLLLNDSPAILGTSTKLEISSVDNGVVTSKDAVKATVGESFISDFRYEFWDSIIKNNTFQIILGNYSDKNSVFTKIINANYNLPNSKIPVIQEDIGKILQTVRLQGLNFYTDSLNRVFTDYKELLSKTGYANEASQLSSNIENNIKIVNSVLSKANIVDLIRTYANLPYDQKNKDLTITEELHYSKYSDGVFINQTLADNYRIFGNENLFNQFVKIQEDSFVENYNNEFPDNENKIIFNKVRSLKTNEFNQIIEKLNIPKTDYANNLDMESVVLQSGEINPLIKKWLWLNSMFRNEYIFMTAKGEYMHPHKNNSSSRSGEFNEDYWNNYRNEVSGRLSSMAKRNVIFTASIETPTRNTEKGVPDDVNVAAIDDNSALVFTPSGHKKYNQDAYDGSSYIDDTYNRMIESSFPGKGYAGTKKQFGTLITPYGVTIKKDAETVITNDKIRNSFGSQVSLLNKKKQMLGIPLSDLVLDFEQSYYDKYFLDRGLLKSITKIKLEHNPTTNSNQIKVWTSTESDNGWIFNKPETYTVNTLFDVWSSLGGMYSVDEHRNFTEGSNELLYDIVTSDQNLKSKIIHILSNKSALKAGATNLNHKDSWFNDETLMYSTYKNRFMGPQLDASHGVDNSEIKEITQLISALAQNGYTSDIAQEAYNDIANVIKKSAQPYIDNLNSNNSNLYQYLTNKFIETINNSKGESLAKSLIHHLKQDKVKIPFSNVNFFNMFVKDVVTRLNNEFISRHYSGIGSVLLPSHGIIQLYDVLIDGKELVMTQQDLIKEALNNYNQEDFVSKYGREPESNFEIIEDYKNIIFADEEITNNYFEVGDTIKLVSLGSPESLYTLTTPEDYYKLKEIISQYQQNAIAYNLYKVRNIPRDLKPTMHNFYVNGVKHNVYDFKSIKMLYTFKNLVEDLKKGKTIDINSDIQDLSEFGDVIAKRNNSSYNLLSNLTSDSLPVIELLEKYLRRFVQREYDLLNQGLFINQNLPIASIIGNDTFVNPVSDVLQHYSAISHQVNNLNFKSAEKIIGDIYQTTFNRGDNDSMYEIYRQGSEYFKNKISKYYDNDNTESDLKIYTSRSDNPIYIKYVDELGPLDRTINISSSIDSDEGLRKAYIRYNEQGEEVYSFSDADNIRVSTDENGNETIYIKFGSKFRNGHHRNKSFNKNLRSIVKSFKGSLQAIVPLMNRDESKVNFHTYVINNEGKSVINENNTEEYNLNELSVNIFKDFSGYSQDVDNYYDSSWVQVNKENILNSLSNKTFASWQKSHELVDARIPGQSMQSFMPMRNVAYMNTLTNDSYVSINQIYMQGSDFDIDKAYTLGSTFTSKGTIELWSDLTNYSTIEQLNELEKLPIPNGIRVNLNNSGINITQDYLEIEQSLKDVDYSYELPVSTISMFNNLIRKIGNSDSVNIRSDFEPITTDISDFEGTIIEYVDHIDYHTDGRPIGARNINKGEKIQLALNVLQDKFNSKTWTNPVNSEPLPEDIFSNFEEFLSFVLLHEKAHEYIFIQPNEDLVSYETRINNEALRRLGKVETSITPEQLVDLINKHNLSDSYLKEGEAIKNSVVSRIKQISSNPSNQIIANTPVDVQDWHDAIKSVLEKRNKISRRRTTSNTKSNFTWAKTSNNGPLVENTSITEISEISEIKKDNKKTEYILYNSIRKENVTKTGYKLIIPEFPDVEMYLTKDLYTILGKGEAKNWYVEVNVPNEGAMTFPTPLARTQKEVIETLKNEINRHSKIENNNVVLKSIGINLNSTESQNNSFNQTTTEEPNISEESEIIENSENITETELLSPYDILSYYKQQYNASVGKDDVGIAANGVKALYALSSYYNTYYNKPLDPNISNSFKTFHKVLTFKRDNKILSLGGHFTTIADVQMSDETKNILKLNNLSFNVRYVNAANNVSGFLSAATDNAKELIMAKVNASTDLAAMHLYMLILGFDIESVVEIMTSDEMSEIIKRMEGNIFTTGESNSFLNIVNNLKNEYIKIKDFDRVHNLNTYETIYRSAQELTTLSRLLGINQKRSADTWEIYRYLNIFSRAISDAESKYVIPKKSVSGKVSVDFDKYAKLLQDKTNVPLDLSYVKNVIIKADQFNIMEGNFDFEQYFSDPEYKQVTKEYYNLIKETFNVFDIIDEVPHFKEMVNSLVLFHNILKRFSSKYDYVFDTYRNITSDQNPDKKMLNKGILYYDTKAREDWLRSESMLDFTFNLKDLMKLANKTEMNIYNSSEARINSKKDAYTDKINIDDESNPIISLDSNEGIANFKLAFEQLLLPILQANLKDSNFLKIDSIISEFGLKRTAITPTIPLSNSNVPALIKQFQKALLSFNNLDKSFDVKYQIKNSTGEYVKWRDLLFVYNLLINNERYGNKRLTPLFQDYMKEKDTLGYDYIRFWSEIDSNRNLALDDSDIKFYALNENGVHGRTVSNNPDFVISTDLKTTEADRNYNKNINDIVRLLKEGGFIITLKC